MKTLDEKIKQIITKAKVKNKILPIDKAFEKNDYSLEIHKGKLSYFNYIKKEK